MSRARVCRHCGGSFTAVGRNHRSLCSPECRLKSKVAINAAGCWEWTGSLDSWGYGRFSVEGIEGRGAHRISYTLFVGPVPPDLVLDHLCRNPRCVNPEHLEVVTGRENTLRGESPAAQHARATSCTNGHEFTPDNTRIEVRASGKRRCCRACGRDSQARYLARRSQAVAS